MALPLLLFQHGKQTAHRRRRRWGLKLRLYRYYYFSTVNKRHTAAAGGGG
ncbi:MAG: hypothetical protein RSE40_07405 [Hydrogenoanaerobacterium sp.]